MHSPFLSEEKIIAQIIAEFLHNLTYILRKWQFVDYLILAQHIFSNLPIDVHLTQSTQQYTI